MVSHAVCIDREQLNKRLRYIIYPCLALCPCVQLRQCSQPAVLETRRMDFLLRGPDVSEASAGLVKDFLILSSLKTSFLVVSSCQLVAGTRAPSEEELCLQKDTVMSFIDKWERDRVMMISDFEGEMPGHGGELVTAAFLPTIAVDKDNLACLPQVGQQPAALGLLVDLRSSLGVLVLKRVMESKAITKLIWGADADLQSLIFQALPAPLNVQPETVIDIQLAYSEPTRRLGMQRMLESVPANLVRGLPCKEQIDFDNFHSPQYARHASPAESLPCHLYHG
ncbi:unnamed protein product [Polarella glacialis]|uniref:Uncharacterized protein n=1 Tax=Polarella glacialis TaxID=89957 RepID=A0A813G9C2_POLGL|nr:unnamed protein product [Polarella glacialis]